MRLSRFPGQSAAVLLLLFPVWLCPHSRGDEADQLTRAVQAAVAKADPSVVRIRVLGTARALAASGGATVTTGVAISDDGDILTSAFALQGDPQAVLVETQQGETSPAKIVATDHLRKLVLLKAEGSFQPAAPVPIDQTAPGQWAIAVGRFFSSEGSNVSVGIVSALNRIHGLAVQTDAKISPLNYGGPLIDLQGRVMGILVPLSPGGRDDPGAGVEWYDSGIGFAIPLEDAIASARRLQDEGDLYPGRVGISIATDSPWTGSVTIREVAPGGPADNAGIRPGDEIVSAGGAEITRQAHFETAVARVYAGETLALEIQREDMILPFEVPLAQSLPQPGYGFLGLLPLGSADTEGEAQPIAMAVLPGTPAADAGLTSPVFLKSIDGQQIGSLPELYTAVNSLLAGAAVSVEYLSGREEPAQTVALTAAELPAAIPWQSELEIHSLLPAPADAPDSEVPLDRDELELGPAGRCVILRVPSERDAGDSRPLLPGVVVLCSESEADEADILRRWEPVIRSCALQVVVPRNAEGDRLSVTDAPMIREALVSLRQSAPYDPLRVLAIAKTGQTALAASLALTPRSPVRAAAFQDGWFSPEPGLELGRTRRALYFMDAPTDAQSAALHDQAVSRMAKTGARVFRLSTEQTSDTLRRQAIGDLSLLLKAI